MTYIPSLDEMAAVIAPLMKLSAKIELPSAFEHDASLTVRQHLVLMAVDTPEPFPKQVTPLYKLRERQFGEKLEQALGQTWVVAAGQDHQAYLATSNALKSEAVGGAFYSPERTILFYSKQSDDIVPGTDKRSGSAISFRYVAAEFETPELKLAWQICL